MAADAAVTFRLQRDVDPTRDHVRGGGGEEDRVTVVLYGDFLCPYCRRLIPVLARLREALGNRLVYVFRHFPNERAHPGAERVARATEAAAKQNCFWEMHDVVYAHELPITERVLRDTLRRRLGFLLDARSIGTSRRGAGEASRTRVRKFAGFGRCRPAPRGRRGDRRREFPAGRPVRVNPKRLPSHALGRAR